MNVLTKAAHWAGEIKAAYDGPLLQKAYSLQVDSLGRTLPNFQMVGGNLTWLSGSWAEKMRGQVWRVANFYATTGAQIPLALYKPGKDGKAERVVKHPVLDLLYQPNPDMGYFMFLYSVLLQLRSAGNSFITDVTPEFGSSKGKPGELWTLPLLNVVLDTDGPLRPVKGYWYTPDLSKPGERQYLERNQVLHLKQYAPDGGVWGMGCITAAEKEITGDDSSISAQVELLQNRGPRGASWFKPLDNKPVELGTGVVQQVKNVLNGRGLNRGRIEMPVLTQEIGYTAFGVSSTDMQILEFRRANFSDLCSYYGVPSLLLNDKEGTTFANLEAARKMLYSQALMPVLGYLASELSRWLVPKFDNTMWLEPDTSGIAELQEDKAAKVAWLKDAWWITTQRKQELVGETPDPALPKYLVPAGLVDPLAIGADPQGAEDAAAKLLKAFGVNDYPGSEHGH